MRTTVQIDEQGRLVLPRAVRERLGVRRGQRGRLVLWESGDTVLLQAEPRAARIDFTDGLPALEVEGLDEVRNDDVVDAVRQDREQR